MCKVNKLIANSVRRWVPKEELDNAKREKSTCPRVIVFKRLGPKFVTKDHNKTLEVSQVSMGKKEERKVVYKQRNGSHTIRHHNSTLERSSSEYLHLKKVLR